jgi:hypothetical protein
MIRIFNTQYRPLIVLAYFFCLGQANAFRAESSGRVTAFPSAEDYGRFALGGRGGDVHPKKSVWLFECDWVSASFEDRIGFPHLMAEAPEIATHGALLLPRQSIGKLSERGTILVTASLVPALLLQ